MIEGALRGLDTSPTGMPRQLLQLVLREGAPVLRPHLGARLVTVAKTADEFGMPGMPAHLNFSATSPSMPHSAECVKLRHPSDERASASR